MITLKLTEAQLKKLEEMLWHTDEGPNCEDGWASDELQELRQIGRPSAKGNSLAQDVSGAPDKME